LKNKSEDINMISDSLFRIIETLNRYLDDPHGEVASIEDLRKRLIRVRDDAEYIKFLVDTREKNKSQYTIPVSMNDEDFARLVRKHELHESEDGSFAGNYHGIFPNRAIVERVLGGAAEQVAYQKGPFCQIHLYRNTATGEYHQQYWAQSCGDAYHSAVKDLPSWLADIGEASMVYAEFTDSNLVAFNLPKDLWDSVKSRAGAGGLQPTALVQQVLGAYLRSEGDTMRDGSAVEPSQACSNHTPEDVQAVVERIRQRASSR
jgi:hypothetical protein